MKYENIHICMKLVEHICMKLVEIQTHRRHYGYPLILPRMKKIRSKMKARSVDNNIINFSNTQGKFTLQSVIGSDQFWNSSEIL